MNYANINNEGEIIFSSNYPISHKELKTIQTGDDLINKIYSFENSCFVDDIESIRSDNVININKKFNEVMSTGFFSKQSNKIISSKNLYDLKNELTVIIEQVQKKEIDRYLFQNEFYLTITELKILNNELEDYIFNIIQKRNALIKQNSLCKTVNDFKNVTW